VILSDRGSASAIEKNDVKLTRNAIGLGTGWGRFFIARERECDLFSSSKNKNEIGSQEERNYLTCARRTMERANYLGMSGQKLFGVRRGMFDLGGTLEESAR
jgi:hypothetical protein